MAHSPYSRRNPVSFHASIAAVLAAMLAAGLWYLTSGHWTWRPWAAAWLAAVNVAAFAYYGFDKWQARRGGRRVPEKVLFGLALVGGSLGAYVAMQTFRHKTIKGSFRIVFWAIIALQIGLMGYLSYHGWAK